MFGLLRKDKAKKRGKKKEEKGMKKKKKKKKKKDKHFHQPSTHFLMIINRKIIQNPRNFFQQFQFGRGGLSEVANRERVRLWERRKRGDRGSCGKGEGSRSEEGEEGGGGGEERGVGACKLEGKVFNVGLEKSGKKKRKQKKEISRNKKKIKRIKTSPLPKRPPPRPLTLTPLNPQATLPSILFPKRTKRKKERKRRERRTTKLPKKKHHQIAFFSRNQDPTSHTNLYANIRFVGFGCFSKKRRFTWGGSNPGPSGKQHFYICLLIHIDVVGGGRRFLDYSWSFTGPQKKIPGDFIFSLIGPYFWERKCM